MYKDQADSRQQIAKIHDYPVCQREMGGFDRLSRQRHEELTSKFASSVEEVVELADGFAFGIRNARESIVDVAEWVSLESRCCSFLKFTIELEPGDSPLTVSITGGPGVKEFLAAEVPAEVLARGAA